MHSTRGTRTLPKNCMLYAAVAATTVNQYKMKKKCALPFRSLQAIHTIFGFIFCFIYFVVVALSFHSILSVPATYSEHIQYICINMATQDNHHICIALSIACWIDCVFFLFSFIVICCCCRAFCFIHTTWPHHCVVSLIFYSLVR